MRFKATPINYSKLLINFTLLSLIAALWFYLFKDTALWFYQRWTAEDTYYSHAFFIPLISGYFIYNQYKKQEIFFTKKIELLPIAGTIISLFVFLVGRLLSINVIAGFALISFTITALAIFIDKNAMRRNLFPFLYLFLMLPLPIYVIDSLALPLKLFVAQFSTLIYDLLNISYNKSGFIIETAKGVMVIENPCSGLRSFVAFFSIGCIFVYIHKFRLPIAIVSLLSIIPITLVCNIIRVQFLLLVTHYYGIQYTRPETALHSISGLVMFMTGIAFFIILNNFLQRWIAHLKS